MRAIDTLLADRGQLFQALFLAAPIPKALVDLEGHVLVANPMMCALTGRTADELAGRHVDLLAHPDDAPVGDLGLVPGPGEPMLDPNGRADGARADLLPDVASPNGVPTEDDALARVRRRREAAGYNRRS